MSLEVKGKVEKILDVQSGVSKANKEWSKQSFILRTTEEYNNLYCFDVFGTERLDKIVAKLVVGQDVTVFFNVNCNEYNDKYYTSLDCWKVDIDTNQSNDEQPINEMPFPEYNEPF